MSLFLTPLDVIPFSSTAAEAYGRIRADLKRRGKSIGANALFIAAHAVAEGALLVTNNEREFRRVRGLRVENWVEGAIASGQARPPIEEGDPTEDWPAIQLPSGTANSLLDEDRDER